MLLKFKTPFGETEEKKLRGVYDVGLRILTQNHSQTKPINVVSKSTLTKLNPLPATVAGAAVSSPESCFLKSCHLCNKKLRLDKEVYMYRGDQGFCSKECRERQMVIDDMRELEQSTKQMVQSYRRCGDADRRETRLLLEELRGRHKSNSIQNQNQLNWTLA